MKRFLGPGFHRSLLGIAILASTACAAGSRTSRDPFAGGSGGSASGRESRQIRVEVQNSNFNEATVEARGVGVRRRLGRVPGTRSEVFTLDWTTVALLYFEVDLLGGGTCTTRDIEVAAGQTVRLIVDSVARIRADGVSRLCDVQRLR